MVEVGIRVDVGMLSGSTEEVGRIGPEGRRGRKTRVEGERWEAWRGMWKRKGTS